MEYTIILPKDPSSEIPREIIIDGDYNLIINDFGQSIFKDKHQKIIAIFPKEVIIFRTKTND